MSNPPGPPRRRRCAECGEVFASPAIFLKHKDLNGNCRPATSLVAFGMTFKAGAWQWAQRPAEPPREFARRKK